jgi:hypothetical protein
MNNKKSNEPIVGPEWSKAAVIRESGGTKLREVKGLEAFRREVSNTFNNCLANMKTEETSMNATPSRSENKSGFLFGKKG